MIDKKYHQLVIDSHLDFIKSGAEVIVTSNFSARKTRMQQNKVGGHFNYANEKAGELAQKAKEISKKNPAQGRARSRKESKCNSIGEQRLRKVFLERRKVLALYCPIQPTAHGFPRTP